MDIMNLPVPYNLLPKKINGIKNFTAEWSRDMEQYNPLGSNMLLYKIGRYEYLSLEIEDNDGKLHQLDFIKDTNTGEVFLQNESHTL